MGQEIDLLKNYPKTIRDINARLEHKTDEDRKIARKFGKDFFDGSRNHGYGGFFYNSRFWEPVIPTFQKYWSLSSESTVLDIGCAKGFMIYDMQRLIPGIKVYGIDISQYAIENAKQEVKNYCQVANAINLPFDDNSVDVSISITTLHNLDEKDIVKGLLEIERVSRVGSFVTLDAYRNSEEKERMEAWNLTAKTILHVNDWKKMFREINYNGDYFWFIP